MRLNFIPMGSPNIVVFLHDLWKVKLAYLPCLYMCLAIIFYHSILHRCTYTCTSDFCYPYAMCMEVRSEKKLQEKQYKEKSYKHVHVQENLVLSYDILTQTTNRREL